MKLLRILLSIVLAGLAIPSGAEVIDKQVHQSFSTTMSNPCTGETLRVDVTYTMMFRWTDPKGNASGTFGVHLSAHGTAIGEQSGRSYRVNHTARWLDFHSAGPDGALLVSTEVMTMHFIGEGAGSDFRQHVVLRVIFDDSGTPVLHVDHQNVTC